MAFPWKGVASAIKKVRGERVAALGTGKCSTGSGAEFPVSKGSVRYRNKSGG